MGVIEKKLPINNEKLANNQAYVLFKMINREEYEPCHDLKKEDQQQNHRLMLSMEYSQY
jgi:hypothetical protein